MWYFLRFGGFKPELSAVKVESNFNFFLDRDEVLKKKDTATIFKIYAPNRISVEETHIVPRWFDAEHQFWKLWPCLFFVTDHNFDDELTFAAMSWLWAVITWPIIILTPMCHTYSESWVRALSHGPILVKIVFTKFSRRSERSKKFRFLHFLRASPRNISSGRRSDNFDASGLPNTSSESLCPKFFRKHVKTGETFKNWGLTLLWSQPIWI